MSPVEELVKKAKGARAASRTLAKLSTNVKNRALMNVADAIMARQEDILEANEKDYSSAKVDGLSEVWLDRLLLNPERLESAALGVRKIADLPDPVGEVFDMRTLPNGLLTGKKRVPLGVVGSIYRLQPARGL